MFEELLDVKCECGKTHSLTTRDYVVEPGGMAKLPGLLKKLGLGERPLAVYDRNTHKAAFDKVNRYCPDLDELVLSDDEIHADEKQIELVSAAAPGHSVLLAVGSGVINDVCRYVAYQQGMAFISVPTAGSMDGYVSSGAVVTLKGAKKTLNAVAPVAVVADLDIVAAAPTYLTAAGVGDMLSKYISVAEWHIGHLISGEYYCPFIAGLAKKAVDLIVEQIDSIQKCETSGMGKLVEGLLISGIAIQMAGITRPASSFEHHFSHYLETVPVGGTVNSNALHGEKVGIATIVAAKYYPTFVECLKRIYEEDLPNKFDMDKVLGYYSAYSPGVREMIQKENTPTISMELKKDLLRKNYGKVVEVSKMVPSPESLRDVLKKLNGFTHYKDIGMTQQLFRETWSKCCYIRNRFTMLRLICDYELFDFNTMDD